MNSLTAVTPIDGRYGNQTALLAEYFSEFGLIKYRVRVEIEYLINLIKIPLPQLSGFPENRIVELKEIYVDFSEVDASSVKEIEKRTNHDVKAVEYFIKDKLETLGLERYGEFIHFGLTSQDINNTATPLSLKEGFQEVIRPKLLEVVDFIEDLGDQFEDIPMLARTHGQPASPTRLGKEIKVFSERLRQQIKQIDSVPFCGKFGSATGNLNAQYVAFPDIDWHQFAKDFLENELGLVRSYPTTQIEHYDNLAAFFDGLRRVNTILIDMARDLWQYISMEYFKQKIKKGEVGSSTMPHKVNPIDFENAEGNLGVANAVCEFLSTKLPISRLQRDLTDSTVLRNIGVPMGHSLIAYNSLLKGLGKIQLNQAAIDKDLENNWAVVGEGIQTILRTTGYPNPYEALLELTRKNEKITEESIKDFIEELNVDEEVKERLRQITPRTYVGK
ncbi:adenylosuccinate lyase [Bacteroidota bacterium]